MIDVIIPCYNAHKTLERTLCSVAAQTIKEMVNVYIIDDCSEKNYNEICDKFSKLLHIKELRLDKNQGPGGAREYGTINSNGKYIMYLDSDDFLYDCYVLWDLYKKIEKEKLDIVTSNIYDSKLNVDVGVTEHDLHGKLFRRSLIDKYNIHFMNTLCNDDTIFFYMCYLCTNKIDNLNILTYVYQINDKSITLRKNYWVKNLEMFADNGCILIDFINKNKINKNKSSNLITNMFMIMYHEYNCYNNDKNRKKLINKIKFFYKKATPLLKSFKSGSWNNIYSSFVFKKIPTITFNEFINLLETQKKS